MLIPPSIKNKFTGNAKRPNKNRNRFSGDRDRPEYNTPDAEKLKIN